MFAHAHRETVTLVETTADDAAQGRTDRRILATALVALGTGSRPEVALGAGDTAAAERVRRLTGPASGPRWGQTGLVALVGAGRLAVPVDVALAPAIEAAARDCCSRRSWPATEQSHARWRVRPRPATAARQPSRP